MISLILIALLVGALTLQPAAPVGVALPPPSVPLGVLPELPRVYLDTTYVAPTGATIIVPAGGDFQGALNAASPGSVIVLQAGAAYSGTFTLPAKTGSGWIYVQSSAHTSLPASGTRVGPAQASLMPKIVGNPAITAPSGAHHYRFIGIEFRPPAGVTIMRLIDLSGNNIILDRSYIHGDPTAGGAAGVVLNGSYNAVIDSYLSDWKHTSVDSQAIWGFNGPGPFKIANNYLEGAGENVMFGGSDASSSANWPSDIEIRGNYMYKPLTWRVGDPSYAGTNWVVKNLFELKNARRVLVDGNVFENSWTENQNAQTFAIVLTPRNQWGGNPWAAVQDVTFTHNIVRRAAGAMWFLGWDDIQSSQQLQRVLVQDNLWLEIGAFPDVVYGGFSTGMLFLFKNGPADIVINHNTAFPTRYPLYGVDQAGRGPTTGFVFTNNITPSNQGVGGSGSTMQSLNTYFTGHLFTRNVLVGGSATSYPPDNFFPTSLGLVGFLSLTAGDYHLAITSPYKSVGTDGKDIGADIDAINAATGGSETGLPATEAVAPTTPIAAPRAETTVGAPASGATSGATVSMDTTADDTLAPPSPVTTAESAPPLISSVTVAFVTSSETAITWATNKASDSQVEYGPTTAYGTVTSVDTGMVTAHAVILNGLTAGTTYHVRVRSRDAVGILATSSDFTFTTASAGP